MDSLSITHLLDPNPSGPHKLPLEEEVLERGSVRAEDFIPGPASFVGELIIGRLVSRRVHHLKVIRLPARDACVRESVPKRARW